MSRTYWKRTGENSFEFLGAYVDGHTVDPKRGKNSPQFGASILDIQGLSINETLTLLADRVTLVDLPAKIRNHLVALAPVSLEWGQLEGFVK